MTKQYSGTCPGKELDGPDGQIMNDGPPGTGM